MTKQGSGRSTAVMSVPMTSGVYTFQINYIQRKGGNEFGRGREQRERGGRRDRRFETTRNRTNVI
eukprot:834044-Amorphochlora_amoeboformis.AAC.1